MPPRRRAAAVPITVDVDALRSALNAGKIVRVVISRSAQFPDGAIGRVRGIGSPAIDGEEFIQVEVNLNGTKDVLPFTPADLTPVTRSRRTIAGGPVNGSATGAPPALRPPPSAQRAAPGRARPAGPDGPSATPADQPGRPPTPAATVAPAAMHGGTASPPLPADPSGSSGTSRVSATEARGKRPRRGQPPVSITISTSDTEPPQWRIEARVGARAAVKSTPVPAARVWELITQLDNELLTTTVGAILEEHRRATQARADELAAQLKAVRAELDSLPPRKG